MFAAFLDHTDVQIGHLVDGLKRLGQLDNTMIFAVADNGASQEGGPFGVMHEMKFLNGILETPDEAIARIDDIGGHFLQEDRPVEHATVINEFIAGNRLLGAE